MTAVKKPESDFKFPKNSKNRSFRYDWLNQFPWLCYSFEKDGAYCLYCVMFGDAPSATSSSKIKKLFSQPLQNWQGAASDLKPTKLIQMVYIRSHLLTILHF